jgi:hypothetical protein
MSHPAAVLHAPSGIRKYGNRITEMEQILRAQEDQFQSMGVNNGLMGLSLFYYYYALYTGEEKYLEQVSEYIGRAFGGINADYQGHSCMIDLMEMGYYLHFLREKGILEEDLNPFLEDADSLITEHWNNQLKACNIDPMVGVIHAGNYFLARSQNKDFRTEIDATVALLDQLAVTDPMTGEVYWYFDFRNKTKPVVELGLFHGMAGVLNFLLSVYEQGGISEAGTRLLFGGFKFLKRQMTLDGLNRFPFDALTQEPLTTQNLAYGDLCLSYLFLRGGKLLQVPDFTHIGNELLDRSARMREQNTTASDANILYGSAGLAAFFNQLSAQTHSIQASDAAAYWLDKTLQGNKYLTPWAGYQASFNTHLVATQLNYAEGICGIGIVLMAHELEVGHEHLKFLNYQLRF